MTIDLTKLYPEILAILGLLADQFGGTISNMVAANPKMAMSLGVLMFILNKFVSPPHVPATGAVSLPNPPAA